MPDAYTEVRGYIQRIIGKNGGPAPAAGSPDWMALSDDHPAKLVAVLTAGTLQVLTQQLDAIADRREAAKVAAVEVSRAADWAGVAKRVRDRDQAVKSGAYIERQVRP